MQKHESCDNNILTILINQVSNFEKKKPIEFEHLAFQDEKLKEDSFCNVFIMEKRVKQHFLLVSHWNCLFIYPKIFGQKHPSLNFIFLITDFWPCLLLVWSFQCFVAKLHWSANYIYIEMTKVSCWIFFCCMIYRSEEEASTFVNILQLFSFFKLVIFGV